MKKQHFLVAQSKMAAAAEHSAPVETMEEHVASLFDKEWFGEKETELWPGQQFRLKVKKILHQEQSEWQKIVVFESTDYGTCFSLDGAIQVTERDEYAYQESIVHIPLFSHPNPKSVLIIGAGDGGVLREVVKHKNIERIVMCEIDQRVCEVAKKFLSKSTATELIKLENPATRDPRINLHFEDAAIHIARNKGAFDVIIVDSSDPIGPAESLFSLSFYSDMAEALKPGGIICTQGECMWQNKEMIQRLMSQYRTRFPTVDYAYCTIPSYPSGQIGFIMASTNPDTGFLRTVKRPVPAEVAATLRYYTPAIHEAAFVLPKNVEEALVGSRAQSVVPSVVKAEAASAAAAAAGAALQESWKAKEKALKNCAWASAALAAVSLGALAFTLIKNKK